MLTTFLLPGRKVPHIATVDIGRFAAQALLDPAHDQRVWPLTGNDYTPEEIAAVFSKVLGRTVHLQPIPDDQTAEVMKWQGAPEAIANAYQEMTKAINSGYISLPADGNFRRGTTTAEAVIARCSRKGLQ